MSSSNSNNFLDTEKAAEHIEQKPATLATWRSTGRYDIPYYKIGGKVRYRLSDLDHWLETRLRGRNGDPEAA